MGCWPLRGDKIRVEWWNEACVEDGAWEMICRDIASASSDYSTCTSVRVEMAMSCLNIRGRGEMQAKACWDLRHARQVYADRLLPIMPLDSSQYMSMRCRMVLPRITLCELHH